MAYRSHAARDIVPGSLWPLKAGRGYARVVSSAAGWVTYEREDGTPGHEYHAQFRATFDAPYNSRDVRSQFRMCTSNLSCFHVFWSTAVRRIFARSAVRSITDARKAARGSPLVPDDAVYVGTYTDASSDAFLDDLNARLAAAVLAAGHHAGV